MRRDSTGLDQMKSLARQLPDQLLDGFRAGLLLAPIRRVPSTSVAVAGMGGSAIAADLFRSLAEAETNLTVSVQRSPVLATATPPVLVVVITSYSGDTWEALDAYDDAGRRGLQRLAMTSGGELARRADRDGVPVARLPAGLPPRSAAGFMLGALLGAFDTFFPESNSLRLRRAAEALHRRIGSYALATGAPARLAGAVGRRIPFIYADSGFLSLARRWTTQIEENAKRLAVFDETPELFHNALVAWDALGPTSARQLAVVLLEWSGIASRLRRSHRYLERLLKYRGVVHRTVDLGSTDRLEALVGGLSFGDFFSLFLAEAAGVDPHPVEAIRRLKTFMATASDSGR